jgi:hypothetical protein
MLENIPNELKRLRQWVSAGTNKLPLNPGTGEPADVTRPETWGSYESAVGTGYKHIGFVLSRSDPYSIVDLDSPIDGTQRARHQKIYDSCESYAEISQSGNGVHLVVRGSVSHGVRRDKVEVYSSERYMIFTGNVIKALPITDQQPLLDTLFSEMASTKQSQWKDQDDKLPDEEVMAMAWDAANADKFRLLWNGQWDGLYPSQSEADLSLLSMLAFYSKSNEQVKRLFNRSKLGERKKAARKGYLDNTLSIIRSNEPPEIDLSQLKSNANRTAKPAPPPPKKKSPDIVFPPGYVGQLADYFLNTAIRPVPEIALSTAIAFTAGVVGRSYNISGTGLNQYLVLLARTGSGKEGAASGIDALIASVRSKVPMCDSFIGPAAFASGQALIRVLDDRPCFVSILGEFGLTLQQLCDSRAPAPTVMLKKVLLDLYAKSGFTKILRPSVYSDTEKNTKLIQAPNVTILGESTPEEFYDGLDHAHILAGLIPRFSVIEYSGPRPELNERAGSPPGEGLLEDTVRLLTIALTTRQNTTCAPVQLDSDATSLMRAFERFTTDSINDTSNDIERNLWNRAHLKALKLSALIAVGCNPEQPIVDRQCAEWALAFINKEVRLMIRKFGTGDIGSGEAKQEFDIKWAIIDYLKMTSDEREAYSTPAALLREPIIPFHYLRRRTRMRKSFKDDRRGAGTALKMMLEAMVEDETLQQLSTSQARDLFKCNSPLFIKGPNWGHKPIYPS